MVCQLAGVSCGVPISGGILWCANQWRHLVVCQSVEASCGVPIGEGGGGGAS